MAKQNCVFRVRNSNGVRGGDFEHRRLAPVGTLAQVDAILRDWQSTQWCPAGSNHEKPKVNKCLRNGNGWLASIGGVWKSNTVRWQNVSSAGFPTPTSLASATERFFYSAAR
jgi:hypothetical protein